MYKNFIQALSWNSSATFFYKIMLLVHQIALYSVISKTDYGLQSTLFACIYTLIAITNFGLDETCLPFFSRFTQSKQQAYQLITQMALHAITMMVVACVYYTTLLYGSGEFLHNIQAHCNKNLIFLLAIIFCVEAIKKPCSIIMQLAFLQQQAAYGQIALICSYSGMVWGWYAINRSITMYTIFIPMLITSLAELCYIIYNVANVYRTLPSIQGAPALPLVLILKQRIYNYSNQISKTIYSPNMMTIWFASMIGFQQAATIKLYTNSITLAYACIVKIAGMTAGSIFVAMHEASSTDMHRMFNRMTQKYFTALYLFTVMMMVIVGYAWYQDWIHHGMAWYIVGFFTINLVEHAAITYEQFFIAQGKAAYIAIINLIALLLCVLSAYAYTNTLINQQCFVAVVITIKVVSLILLVRVHQQYFKSRSS